MRTTVAVASGGALFAIVALAPSPDAHAQSTDRCEVIITPSAGRTIPANAPALHYVVAATGSHIPQEAYAAPQGIALFDGAAASVPVTVSDDPSYGYRIEPGRPFIAGQTYRLRYPDPCAGSGTFAETQISIGPSARWPTASGTLRLTAGTGDVAYTCFDLSYILRNHPGLGLEISASADLQPFLPIALFEVNVDALSWARTAYGALPHWFSTLPGLLQHPDDILYAACGRMGEGDPQNDCPNRAGGLTPGSHRLMVPVRILGGAHDPTPLAADFTIDCDSGGFGSAGTGGGGGGGAAGTGGAGGGGGGGGCATGGGVPAVQALLLVSILIVLAWRGPVKAQGGRRPRSGR